MTSKELMISTITVTPYVAFVIPKDFGGELPYKFCKTKNKCSDKELSVFGSLHQAAKKGSPVTSKNFSIAQDALFENVVKEDKIPLRTPKKLKWHKILAKKESKKFSPLEAFMVYELQLKGKDKPRKIAHLPKGVDKEKYGDLLDDYEVKRYCQPLKLNVKEDIRWNLGNNCSSSSGGQKTVSRTRKGPRKIVGVNERKSSSIKISKEALLKTLIQALIQARLKTH